MLRYGLYSRKSDKEDGDTIKSIEDQKAYWNERAHQHNLLIAKIYEENKSAKIPGTRPVYKQMIADLKAGRIDAVLVWHVNRLARNMAEAGELAQLLIDGKIKAIRTPVAVYTSADNILPLLLEQGTATQFSRDLSRTMVLTMEQMTKDGGWPHRAQIGYLNARDPLNARRGIVVPDPERFPLVRRGMEMMLTGNYSMRQVTDAMNAWGLRTRPTDNHPAQPLSYTRGYLMFHDPFYAGYVSHKGVLY
jgi:site-specific DNA recombinase